MEENYKSQIPDDLLIEILARLPVKSLIKFTCVCKFWLSLIKSPEFAAKQYATRTKLLRQQNSPYDCHNLMVCSMGNYVKRVEFLVLCYETLDVSAVFECKPDSVDDEYRNVCHFYGLCNGIICVELRLTKPALLLWNPSTREVFRPAKPKSGLSNWLGFGFDDKTNDYKIVAFQCHYHGPYRVQLYSLALNSWRDLEEAAYDYGPRKHLISDQLPGQSNGRMCHWLCFESPIIPTNYDGNPPLYAKYFLLSFDMVDEVFVETPIPESYRVDCRFVPQLSHHMYPALFAYGVDDVSFRVTYVDVWILNEYGAAGYWTKHLSVTLPDHVIVAQPRGICKNGGLLFIDDIHSEMLTYYSPVNQEVKSLHLPGGQVFGYTESLFCIKSFCQLVEEEQGEDSYQEMPYCFCEIDQSSSYSIPISAPSSSQ